MQDRPGFHATASGRLEANSKTESLGAGDRDAGAAGAGSASKARAGSASSRRSSPTPITTRASRCGARRPWNRCRFGVPANCRETATAAIVRTEYPRRRPGKGSAAIQASTGRARRGPAAATAVSLRSRGAEEIPWKLKTVRGIRSARSTLALLLCRHPGQADVLGAVCNLYESLRRHRESTRANVGTRERPG